jgi:multidrug efflux pump subunit AcrA (membrane-fusion protein)
MPDEITLDDGAVEVEIPAVAETPAVVVADKPVDPAEGIAELKAQLAQARQQAEIDRRAREAAEQRAQTSDQQAVQFRSTAEQAQYDVVVRALDQHQAQADMVESQLAQALNAGDHAAAAKAQRQMGIISARIAQLEDGKVAMEQRRQAGPVAPPLQQQDPFEARLAQYSPMTREWIRNHPEVLTNPRKGQIAAGADAKAQEAGLTPDTPEYFAFVEREMGYTTAHPKQQRQPSVAAPPSRETASRTPAPGGHSLNADQIRLAQDLGIQIMGGGTVRLSPKARQSAETCNMTDAEYAKAALADIASGRISERVH